MIDDNEGLEVQDKEAQFNAAWAHVISGLDRAVAWVKEHKQLLRKGFSFYLDRKSGIRVSMGFMVEGDEALQAVRQLFSGKTAKRTVTEDGHQRFLVFDAGLTFEWEIFHFQDRTQTKVEEVVV